jgi:tripeptide aminopeptidase
MINIEKFKQLLEVQSCSYQTKNMQDYLSGLLHEINGVSFKNIDGNIYVTKGNSENYPCVVAHTDTVHKIVENLTAVEISKNGFNFLTGYNKVKKSQTGIGGDDKVGIWIALQCLEKFDNLKAVFFRDEEVGCHGSYDADMTFFDDCNFVLQCDRKGNSDFVTKIGRTELSSKDFKKDILPIISNFGYSFSDGGMTDVLALKENGIKCSVANMSCGYYNPHQSKEYICIEDVGNTTQMVFSIIQNCGKKSYPHKNSNTSHRANNWNWSNWNTWDSYGIDRKQHCYICDKTGNSHYIREYAMYLCEECIDMHL